MSGARSTLNSMPMAIPTMSDIKKVANVPNTGDLVYDHNVDSFLMYLGGDWQAIAHGIDLHDRCDEYKCAYCHTLSKN